MMMMMKMTKKHTVSFEIMLLSVKCSAFCFSRSDICMQLCSRCRNCSWMMFEKQTIHIGAWCTLERNHHCQQITNAHERKYDGNMKGNMEVDGNLRRNIEVICNSFATNLICDSAMASNLLGSKIMVVLKDLRQNVLFNGIPRQSSLLFRYMSARSAAYWIFKYRKMYSNIQSGCQVLLDLKLEM